MIKKIEAPKTVVFNDSATYKPRNCQS